MKEKMTQEQMKNEPTIIEKMDDPTNKKRLLKKFKKALKEQKESIRDIIYISHPLKILKEISTLEEIQCAYLMGLLFTDKDENKIEDACHKQDMPFMALTHKNMYYCQVKQGYIEKEEIQVYSRDDDKKEKYNNG